MREIELRCGKEDALAGYVAKQLDAFFPDPSMPMYDVIRHHLPATLCRLSPILAACKSYQPYRFDHFNSMQYTTFLYLLANEIYLRGNEETGVCERLFLLNKALAGIDLFYRIQMPELFLLAHACAGTVFVNTTYGEKLVVFNNITIGRFEQKRPEIGAGVVLYPNVVVVGASSVGDSCVVSAGTVVSNATVPPRSLVFGGAGGVVIKESKKDYLSAYFR
jgi:serine O-acetyltransferase